jgi:hypothetical protein
MVLPLSAPPAPYGLCRLANFVLPAQAAVEGNAEHFAMAKMIGRVTLTFWLQMSCFGAVRDADAVTTVHDPTAIMKVSRKKGND